MLILLLVFLMIINHYYINQFLKIFSITLIMIIICKFLFNVSIRKAIITPISGQFIVMVSEFIFAATVMIITNINNEQFVENYFTDLLTNLVIAVIAIILTKLKLGHRVFNYLDNHLLSLKKHDLYIFVAVLIISVSLLQAMIYYTVDLVWILVINTILVIIYSWIIIRIVTTKIEYQNISNKYSVSTKSLSEYQAVINRYRIDNHENKNQLRRLKRKINPDNKEALDYIDNILNTRVKLNEQILNKTKVIPECDLRTLIDAKVMSMEEKKIKNTIHVDKQIKTADFIEMNQNLVEDICKIIGVYLDNAIEAVEDLDKREIQLDFYNIDDYMYISVVNNYQGNLDLDKLNDAGYTTKSNGHGYGLALVNEIVENNKILSRETVVDNFIFKQVLKIKM